MYHSHLIHPSVKSGKGLWFWTLKWAAMDIKVLGGPQRTWRTQRNSEDSLGKLTKGVLNTSEGMSQCKIRDPSVYGYNLQIYLYMLGVSSPIFLCPFPHPNRT